MGPVIALVNWKTGILMNVTDYILIYLMSIVINNDDLVTLKYNQGHRLSLTQMCKCCNDFGKVGIPIHQPGI